MDSSSLLLSTPTIDIDEQPVLLRPRPRPRLPVVPLRSPLRPPARSSREQAELLSPHSYDSTPTSTSDLRDDRDSSEDDELFTPCLSTFPSIGRLTDSGSSLGEASELSLVKPPARPCFGKLPSTTYLVVIYHCMADLALTWNTIRQSRNTVAATLPGAPARSHCSYRLPTSRPLGTLSRSCSRMTCSLRGLPQDKRGESTTSSRSGAVRLILEDLHPSRALLGR